MTVHKRSTRVVAMIALTAYLVGCTSWRLEPVSPAALVDQEQPRLIRLTTNDGERLVLERPSVTNDTIVGLRGTVFTGLPLNEVRTVETPKFSAPKTAALLIGTPVALVGLGYLVLIIVCSSSDCFGS